MNSLHPTPLKSIHKTDKTMMLVALVLVLVAVAVTALAQTGCSIFQTACAKTLPTITTAMVLLDDAQTKTDQAQVIVSKIANPELRDKAQSALDAVRAGLVAAEGTLSAASTACTEPNLAVVFKVFMVAWRNLQPFISLLGGPSAGSKVQDPLVFGMLKGG